MGKKIAIICPYPFDTAASQRFRYEQYLGMMTQKGWHFDIFSFLDNATWKILYKPGHLFLKFRGILSGFIYRFLLLGRLKSYDFVLIHREAAPVGPPFFEWFIAKILKKKIIYDFDDAIWIPNTSENNKIASGLKWHGKVKSICKWSYRVSTGNKYLQKYALQFNANSKLNPTTLDTVNLHNPKLFSKKPNLKPIIGWTGTHSTMNYLWDLLPVFQQLEKEFSFEFLVISNKQISFPIESFRYLDWSKETEIQDLFQLDIGIMPLTDDVWANGKCGFKALQYMSLGIPSVVSPVGINTEIVQHGENGFLCAELKQWDLCLRKLLIDKVLRTKIGNAGKETVLKHFSNASNTQNFLSLFD